MTFKKKDQSCEKKRQICVVINTYLRVIFMVQPRQQPNHDAQDPRMHDHSITFIHPADRREAGYQSSSLLCFSQTFLDLSNKAIIHIFSLTFIIYMTLNFFI